MTLQRASSHFTNYFPTVFPMDRDPANDSGYKMVYLEFQ
jgi:hypothetical protein